MFCRRDVVCVTVVHVVEMCCGTLLVMNAVLLRLECEVRFSAHLVVGINVYTLWNNGELVYFTYSNDGVSFRSMNKFLHCFYLSLKSWYW